MITFTQSIIKRVVSKLGGPLISIELDEEQMSDLFTTAQRDWHLYSPLSKLEEKQLTEIENVWIESYFHALCKETLGRVRGKYQNGIPIPGVDKIVLDSENLLTESLQEKEKLIGLLIPPANKIMLAVYINVYNMPDEDIKEYARKISAQLKKDNSYSFFIFPVKDQNTRIECIYPNFVYDEQIKEKLNICLDNIINNLKNE